MIFRGPSRCVVRHVQYVCIGLPRDFPALPSWYPRARTALPRARLRHRNKQRRWPLVRPQTMHTPLQKRVLHPAERGRRVRQRNHHLRRDGLDRLHGGRRKCESAVVAVFSFVGDKKKHNKKGLVGPALPFAVCTRGSIPRAPPWCQQRSTPC